MFRTLIIEDNCLYRKLLKETLQVRFPKMVILEANDGEEALKEIEMAIPNLILMDIQLPGESGLELTRKIRDRYREVSIVILTSYDLPEYREVASKYKADNFLSKSSTTKEEIISLVEAILSEYHFIMNEEEK
ncbi:MAG: response regulator [Thermodesulfobacteriota bacterium]